MKIKTSAGHEHPLMNVLEEFPRIWSQANQIPYPLRLTRTSTWSRKKHVEAAVNLYRLLSSESHSLVSIKEVS